MTPQTPALESSVPKMDMDVSTKTMTRASRVAEHVGEPRKWNTKNLGLRLVSDFTAGASAAVLVAPIITMIDKYVTILLS